MCLDLCKKEGSRAEILVFTFGCNLRQVVVFKRKDLTGGWEGLQEPPNRNILLCSVGIFRLLLCVCKYKH